MCAGRRQFEKRKFFGYFRSDGSDLRLHISYRISGSTRLTTGPFSITAAAAAATVKHRSGTEAESKCSSLSV